MDIINRQARLFFLPFLFVLSQLAAFAETESQESGSYHKAYFLVDELNATLPERPARANLHTPQAAVEFFLDSCRRHRFSEAAYTLNLNRLLTPASPTRAADLAKKLYRVLEKKLWIDWEGLPDRPDGMIEVGKTDDPLIGVPRRSLELGKVALDSRDIAIRLQRVKTPSSEPVWVFSAATVENIEALYAQYGPSRLQRNLPDWANRKVFARIPVWQWLAIAVFAVLSGLAFWIVYRASRHAVRKIESPLFRRIGNAARKPLAVISGLALFSVLNATLLTLTGPVSKVLNPTLTVLMVAACGWLGIRLIGQLASYFDERYADGLANYDNGEARRTLTYIAVARRLLIFVALMVSVGIVLSQLNLLTTLGISLLASAGVISVIAGIAAQSVLANIMAGIQIAITRPAKIGDSVLFEDQWGFVEEITYTYITIRTWDQRRVIVPLKYFLSHPFENWSMRDAHLIKPIYLYLDYRADVQALRKKFEELLKRSDDWDEKNPPSVQVTNMKEETMEVRALCSAKDPAAAWNLHCLLREQLIDYVQDLEHGRYLPKRRIIFHDASAADAPHQAPRPEQ